MNIINPFVFSGPQSGSYYLDGAGDAIFIPTLDSLIASTNFTISMWVKYDQNGNASGDSNHYLGGVRGSAGDTFYFPGMVTTQNYTFMKVNNVAQNLNVPHNLSGTNPSPWFMMTVTCEANGSGNPILKVYVNNSLKATRSDISSTNWATWETGGTKWGIGGLSIQNQTTATYDLLGHVAEVSVWDEDLSAPAIAQIYTSMSGGAPIDHRVNVGNYTSSSNLAHYFRFKLGAELANEGSVGGSAEKKGDPVHTLTTHPTI